LLNTNQFPEPALADFKKAWQLEKLESYALGAGTLLQERKPDSAVVFLRSAVEQIPESLMLRLSLARAYDLAGKTEEALLTTGEILDREPRQVDVLKFRADLLHRKRDTAAAIQTLEKAYSLAPHDIDLNYELALQYAETRNKKVLRLCDSLIRQDTDSSNLHAEPAYFKGIYYANTGDRENALKMFDEAILRNYYYLNAYIEKGRVLLDLQRIEEALKSFNLVLTLSPKFPDAYYWIARSQELQGNTEEARLNYQRAYSLDPEFSEARDAANRLEAK
jgi:tetratricopeptide (TPR) repeat protein